MRTLDPKLLRILAAAAVLEATAIGWILWRLWS